MKEGERGRVSVPWDSCESVGSDGGESEGEVEGEGFDAPLRRDRI